MAPTTLMRPRSLVGRENTTNWNCSKIPVTAVRIDQFDDTGHACAWRYLCEIKRIVLMMESVFYQGE